MQSDRKIQPSTESAGSCLPLPVLKHMFFWVRSKMRFCPCLQVTDALIMGADYYETLEECALIPGCLPMGLGASTLYLVLKIVEFLNH